MSKTKPMPEDWNILDNYIEDMLVAQNNGEISIGTCKMYLAQFLYDATYMELEELIMRVEKLGNQAREHGWAKTH